MLRSVPSTRPDEVGIDPDAAALLLDMERASHVSALPADIVEERVREMAIGLGMAAEIFTSQRFTATELMIVPGLLQLAPGFIGTEASLRLLRHGAAGGEATFFDVMLVAVQLGTGLLIADLLFRRRTHVRGVAGVPP